MTRQKAIPHVQRGAIRPLQADRYRRVAWRGSAPHGE